MLVKPSSCLGCVLYGTGFGFSKIRGSGEEKVLLVGEALGEEEEKVGLPFIGKTGQLLERIIYRTLDPEKSRPLNMERDFWITNTVRCRPPQNNLVGEFYEKEAISRCRHFLSSSIKEHSPKAILAVGGTAFRAATGYEGIDRLRGYTFPSEWGIPVIGTYHPSYLIRGKIHLAKVVQFDILKAIQVARHGVPPRKYSYILHPTPSDAADFQKRYYESLRRDPNTTLAFDIETPWGTIGEKDEDVWDAQIEDDESYRILRISFSFEEHSAITMPWMEPYISVAKALLASSGPKTVWNGNFDVPRLVANDAPVEGEVIDSMHAWKCLEPALPMGLKFVATVLCPDVEAWKLVSTSEPEYYSAADSDILLRCYNKIKNRLTKDGKWKMFQTHFVECGKVLTKMSRRGVKVDKEARNSARLSLNLLSQELELKAQELVPDTLKKKKIFKLNWPTLEKKGFKRADLVLVDDQIENLPKGWMIGPEGFLLKIPKIPRAKRAKKKKQQSLFSESTSPTEKETST